MASESKSGEASSAAYVTLVSAEKHNFVVERKAACVSGMIRTMLATAAFSEAQGHISFPDISTPVLEKVIQYFYYKLQHNGSKTPIPEFALDPAISLEVLLAANYLDC